jgi:hypothetical protein
MTEKIPELRIQFTKRKDGAVVLRCTRRDNSVTWQRHDKNATFYAFHDLRHLAVETTLGLRNGFYGLLADGWDITETDGKGPRGPLSAGSILAEHIVGLLERERAGGAPPLTAEEFNRQIDTMLGSDPNRPRLVDTQLILARTRTEQLHNQWAMVPAGDTLDLAFSRD